MISFKGYCYPSTVILQCVRWYLVYCLSYWDIEEMMKERGIDVDHSTLNCWVLKKMIKRNGKPGLINNRQEIERGSLVNIKLKVVFHARGLK